MHNESKYSDSKYLGMRQGHLTITGYEAGKFICICDCGNEKRVPPVKFLAGKSKTCGYGCSFHHQLTEEDYSKALYTVWRQMIYRCTNPKSPSYATLHANSINVCQEWINDFNTFYEWAINHNYQPGLCLTRKNWRQDYSPNNCKWANREDIAYHHKQRRGKYETFPIFGEHLTMTQIRKKYHVSDAFLKHRMSKGLTLEEAVTLPKYARLTHKNST